MKSILSDIVSHTQDLGNIELVKIVGDDKETRISGVAEDKTVVLEGTFNKPVAEFMGTFGMPNLGKLKVLLNLDAYRENAKIDVTKKSDGVLDGISFVNDTGDFKNSYRFMASEIINEKSKTVKFKGVNWNVEFTPSVSAIQRLKMQASANSEQTTFQAKTENGDLKFFFGDHSSHAGNFVFHPGVSGELKTNWSWPVKTIIGILDLVGDKTFRISDQGAAQIVVDSGTATYTYIVPAQSK